MQSTETECPEKIRGVDWTWLLRIHVGACGGLWTGLMLLICSTYMFVSCMYCVLFDLRKKLKIAETSASRKISLYISWTITICNAELLKTKQMDNNNGELLNFMRKHGRRSVGDGGGTGGCVPPLFRVVDSIGIVPPLFSSEKLRGI